MLHKPAGVVSATEDKKDKTVLDLVREQEDIGKRELFPVGALQYLWRNEDCRLSGRS